MTSSNVITWCVALGISSAGTARGDTPTNVDWSVVLKLDWTLLFGPGVGGSVSADVRHHELTAMGFGTRLGAPFRDLFLSGASERSDVVNIGGEVGYSYFARADRRWWFAGALVSYDQFRTAGTTLSALYVVPRVGVRILLGWRLFVEPSFGVAIRVSPSQSTDGVDVRRAAPVFLLPVGVAWDVHP